MSILDYHDEESEYPNGSNEDNVNHPSHCKSKGGMEAIDVIEEFDLGFHLGNSIKYILRAGKKGPRREDLRKAIWYIERNIEKDDCSNKGESK